MIFLTITAETWEMAGISIAMVFCILVLLVFILTIFSSVAKRGTKAAPKVASANVAAPAAQPVAAASEAEKVAVATALYLYFSNAHDEESGVLTISHNPNTQWHAVLNTRL